MVVQDPEHTGVPSGEVIRHRGSQFSPVRLFDCITEVRWLIGSCQEKIYNYAVASRNREHLCDSVRVLDMRGKRAAHASRMDRRRHLPSKSAVWRSPASCIGVSKDHLEAETTGVRRGREVSLGLMQHNATDILRGHDVPGERCCNSSHSSS